MKPLDPPQVKFFGQLITPDGPLRGTLRLVPSVPAIDFLGRLITTVAYTCELDEAGRFEFYALPTDIGQGPRDKEWKPWSYILYTPKAQFRVSLPAGGPHCLADLLARDGA